MLLRALNEFADLDGRVPTGYAHKPVGFELLLDQDLKGCNLISRYKEVAQAKGKPRLVAPSELVPNLTRANNPPPLLACDNAAFVLGRPKVAADEATQAKENETADRKRAAFDELLSEYAEAADVKDARAFLAWRADGSPGLQEQIDRLNPFELKRLDLDLIAIRLQGSEETLHKPAEAQRFWRARVSSSKGSGVQGHCLSCGGFKAVVDTLPQSLIGALVPGTSTSNVALLSSNFQSASRRASSGLKSAPVCADCANGAVSAFNKMAASEQHRWSGSRDEPAIIWWTKRGAADFGFLGRPNNDVVGNFLSAPSTTNPSPGGFSKQQGDRFYAMSFSGNVARLVIRQWIDLPLHEVRAHVENWFADTATTAIDRQYVSVVALANSCGQMTRHDGRWDERAPHGAHEMLLRCALTGSSPPRSLLSKALVRTRAEIGYMSSSDGRTAAIARQRMNARFGLIRLIANRTFSKEEKMSQFLDEENLDPVYLSGRLFAVRESLQYAALGAVNASITDRFFSRASIDPVSVEGPLVRLASQHLRTLKRKGKEGTEVSFSRRVRALQDAQGPAPRRLSASEQALWIAGYYQQRQADFAGAQAHKSTDRTEES